MTSPGTESKKLQTTHWSQLPPELLVLISMKLPTISSQVRFRSVCKSWRSAAKSTKPPPGLPLLALPTDPNGSSTVRSFFSPSTGTAHSIDLPEAQGYSICASSAGWLVLFNKKLDSLLFNPLTRSTIRLPSSVGTFRKALKINRKEIAPWDISTVLSRHFINCYAFMAQYSENRRECVVAFTKMKSFRFVYCKLGDAKWTKVREDKFIFSFAYLKEKFYIMDMLGDVSVWDVNGEPMKNFVAVPGLKMRRPCYLTTTDEDVLMVDRLGDYSLIDSYEIYRLDASGDDLSWERLQGLGDHRKVFLVPFMPRSVVVSDAYGCRGNSVYFLSCSKTSRNQRVIGAFDVEDGSVELLPGHFDVPLGAAGVPRSVLASTAYGYRGYRDWPLDQCLESFVYFAPRFC